MQSVMVFILTALIVLSGCRTMEGPDPATHPPLFLPHSFSKTGTAGAVVMDEWWADLGSDELNHLIQIALDHSWDLKTLQARVEQAQSGLDKESAAFFPELSVSVGGQKNQNHTQNSSGDTQTDGSHSWDASLKASYTADVFGKLRAGKKRAVFTLLAARQDLRAAHQELTAGIAETWIDIVAVRHKQTILSGQIDTNKTLLNLQKLRFANGKAGALDVSQQREALAEALAQMPLLEKQERLLINQLALVSGKTVAAEIQVAARTLPEPARVPDAGIPSRLLENRADVEAAKWRLISSNWAVRVAKADLLPSFVITAQALFSSGELDLLFRNWVTTLAAAIAGPVLDGGYRKAEVQRTRAVADEQLALYAKTVARAVSEVEDSLVRLEKQRIYIELLEEQLKIARITLADAMLQYQNGQSSYLAYLITWTGIENLERQLVGERALYIKEWIGLHKALGWKGAPQGVEAGRADAGRMMDD